MNKKYEWATLTTIKVKYRKRFDFHLNRDGWDGRQNQKRIVVSYNI